MSEVQYSVFPPLSEGLKQLSKEEKNIKQYTQATEWILKRMGPQYSINTTPANAQYLAKRLNDFSPGLFDIKESTFNTYKSRFNKVVRAANLPGTYRKTTTQMILKEGGPWSELIRATLDEGGSAKASCLVAFMRYCYTIHIVPCEVNDRAALDWIEKVYLVGTLSVKRTKKIHRELHQIWNRMTNHLVFQSYKTNPISIYQYDRPISNEDLSEDLNNELDVYFKNGGLQVPASHLINSPIELMTRTYQAVSKKKKLSIQSPGTCTTHINQLKKILKTCRDAGHNISALKSINDVLSIDYINLTVQQHMSAYPGDFEAKTTEEKITYASRLNSLGTFWAAVSSFSYRWTNNDKLYSIAKERMGQIEEIRARLLGYNGKGSTRNFLMNTMDPKKKDRLHPIFSDGAKLNRLFSAHLWAYPALKAAVQADLRKRGYISAKNIKRAMGLAAFVIEITLPERQHTLATLQTNQVVFSHSGKECSLLVDPVLNATKTGHSSGTKITGVRAEMLKWYYDEILPRAPRKKQDAYFFPACTRTGHKDAKKIAKSVVGLVFEVTGIKIKMHDTRAIAATLYYMITKDIAGARALLGHSESTGTIHKYIDMIGNVASQTLDKYHRSREEIPTFGDNYANPFV